MKRFIAMTSVCIMGILLPSVASACPVCFGDQASAEVQGAKWAIMFLLGVTGTVLSGVATFILYVRKRTRMALKETDQKLIIEER